MITKRDLENLYRSNLSLDSIAEKCSLSRAGVQYWIEKYKIPKRPRHESGFYGYWGTNPSRPLPRSFTLTQLKNLYYNKGLSAQDIGKLFNRSTGSIYRFMKGNSLLRRNPNETNNLKYLKQKPSFRIKKNLNIRDQKLKLAGIMLYWAEGYKNFQNKKGASVNLANSDSKMIEVFLKFLREICGVKEERLRVHLYCYANQNVNGLKNYWSKATNIPLHQFIKPYVRNDFKIDKINKMRYGLVQVTYSDKKLFLQIQKWTEDYLKSLNLK